MFGKQAVNRLITEPMQKTARIAVIALFVAIAAFLFAVGAR